MNATNQLISSQEPEELHADNPVIYSVENEIVILKKKKSADPEDDLCYNVEYFESVGFPGTTVETGKLSPDGIMRGGDYKYSEKLTFPFRYFVFLLQGARQNKNVESENNYPVQTQSDETNPGFFKRLGNYSNQFVNGISSGVNGIGRYFGRKKETNGTNNESPTILEDNNPINVENKHESEPKGDNDVVVNNNTNWFKTSLEQKESSHDENDFQKPQVTPDEYWIVRIPIPPETNTSIIPFGKYEKMEEKIAQMEREKKVDKTMQIRCRKSMYEVGSKFVGVCVEKGVNRSKEESPVGSYMSKVSRKREKSEKRE